MDFMGLPALRLVTEGPASGERRADDGVADAELVTRAISGERWAFEQLYRRHAEFAFGLAIRLQGAPTDVEDLVHDAFLKAHAQLSSLRERDAFRGWLGSIVVSLVRMRLRRGKLLRLFGLSSNEPVDLESLASPGASPEVRAELAQLYALLRVLPADERIAWTLRYVQRHGLEEVAELLECSLATAKRRILRAQRFLREHFVPPAHGSGASIDEQAVPSRKGGPRG